MFSKINRIALIAYIITMLLFFIFTNSIEAALLAFILGYIAYYNLRVINKVRAKQEEEKE